MLQNNKIQKEISYNSFLLILVEDLPAVQHFPVEVIKNDSQKQFKDRID